jgi:thioredoxin-related protein
MLFLLFGLNTILTAKDLTWYDFNEGLKIAEKQKKSVLVDFYADWCHWCKVMDKKTFADKKVAEKLEKSFIAIRVDTENRSQTADFQGKTYSNSQLSQFFGVRGLPTLAFLDSKGEPITILPGYTPADEFIHILNYIDKECYKKMSYTDFKNNQDCAEEK